LEIYCIGSIAASAGTNMRNRLTGIFALSDSVYLKESLQSASCLMLLRPIGTYMNHHSITVLRMREFGESVISNLASDDPRISGSVVVSHPESPASVIACAYPEIVGDWVFVFSMVDGFFLFEKPQVCSWRQESEFKRTILGCPPVAQSERLERMHHRTHYVAA
jgi:hypothetical protein